MIALSQINKFVRDFEAEDNGQDDADRDVWSDSPDIITSWDDQLYN